MVSAADLTKQGIAAYQAGDRAAAADLFQRATEADPAYEMAWLWRSSTAETDGEKRSYLERALQVNPASEPAKRGLAKLGADVAVPPELAAPSKVPATTPLAPHVIQTGPKTWICSVCGKPLVKGALQCFHCKARLSGAVVVAPGVVPAQRRPAWQVALIVLACLAGLLSLAFVGLGSPNAPAAPDRISAWVDCSEFVKKNLKSPSTAQFPSSAADGVIIAHIASNDRWSVLGYVDAQNSFGATLRQDFGCQVSYSGGKVTLHALRIGDQVFVDD